MNITQALSIPLEEFLKKLGYRDDDFKREAQGLELKCRSPLRQGDNTPSFNINVEKNVFYDHGTGAGGTILDFVSLYYGLDRAREVSLILRKIQEVTNYNARQALLYPSEQRKLEQSIKPRAGLAEDASGLVEVREIENLALLDYLKSRGISYEIARKYCNEVHYTHKERVYKAIGFKNNSEGYETRNKYFKRSIGKKDISLIEINNESNNIAVFEGFFDFLSFVEENKEEKQDIQYAIVLNSIALKKRLIDFLDGKNFIHMYMYLDNDEQ